MMMRWFAAVALLLLSGAAAHAGGYGGYWYDCPVDCTGVRVTYIEPTPIYVGTNSESQNNSSLFIGIQGDVSHGACAGNGFNPLMQFGVNPYILSNGTVTHRTWREEAGCNALTETGSLVINSGDTIFLQLECTANCTSGAAGQSWTMTWTNVTTGITQTQVRTGFFVYMDNVYILIEPQSTATDSAGNQPLHSLPVKFFNAQVKEGGSWINIPVAPAANPMKKQNGWQKIKNTPSTMHTNGASPPISGPDNSTAFYICSAVTQTTSTLAPPCPASVVSGTAGIGP